MLDFLRNLETLLPKWPEGVTWTIAQVADYTATPVSTAVDAVSMAIGREFDVQEAITLTDAKDALAALKDRMQSQLAALERREQALRDEALRAYDLTMEKLRVIQVNKDWRSAYKTLSYFVGRYDKYLSADLVINLCGDCIRLGKKAEANTLELGHWLRKAVDAAVRSEKAELIEDILDFIDAFSEIFRHDRGGSGGKLLKSAMETLEQPAKLFNLESMWSPLAVQAGHGA